MLKQIIKIKNFRIFKDYSKSANLKDFGSVETLRLPVDLRTSCSL